ncbi:MAG: group II intron reverse transcriptase/maturase [Sphaerochaetaceae bacterium]|nr:group II intron reverse transcriptase/maturase [Sphaerochaetaceae bacterium]
MPFEKERSVGESERRYAWTGDDADGKEIMREEDRLTPNTVLCEQLVSFANIHEAVKKVMQNKGSAGIDGMGVDELPAHLEAHWPEIREQIVTRTYNPRPVLRREIPKDNGGVRLLGIPTAVDRVIQQALVQVLTPVFEPTFSDYSFGFRPKRSAEDAVRLAQTYMSEGYQHVVDLDLSKFFDTVNHDILMGLIDKYMDDKDVRRLIYVFLKSGVMTNGSMMATALGTPQGGPLSPLLSNIYLTPYDRELEKRGLKFVRYADDCNIFTKSKRSSYRVRDNAKSYLERKLQLTVNMEKTEAGRAVGSTFLGFTFLTNGEKGRLGVTRPQEKKLKKLKDRIRLVTKRNRGVAIEVVIRELNNALRGWIGYFARSFIKGYLEDLMGWIRRRIRQYLWKQWKNGRNRKHRLRQLGIAEWRLSKWKLGSNSHWRMAGLMNHLIENETIHGYYKLVDAVEYYEKLHTKRMEQDGIVLDWRYNSLFG